MLKIVDVHVGTSARGEYVVLQNQGLTTVGLRGWALCGDAYLEADPSAASRQMYIFADDEQIKPYQRVVLFTGEGVNGWRPTNDGKLAYLVYWNRPDRVWAHSQHLHLLRLTASRRVVAPWEVEPVAIRSSV